METTNKKLPRIDSEAIASMPRYTLPQILSRQADWLGSEKVALREKTSGIWKSTSWSEYLGFAKFAALGMISLGLKRAHHVGLILDNGPEWLFGELGIQCVGAVPFPIFSSTVAEDITIDINHFNANFVIAQDLEQINKLLALKAQLSSIKHIVYVDPAGMSPYEEDPWLVSFSRLLELGEKLDREQPDLFIKELWEGKPDDIALVIPTPGTTGPSKRVMLSHANFTAMACNWIKNAPIGIGDNWMSTNENAWLIEQVWGIGIALCGGLVINFPECPESAMNDLRDIGPEVTMETAGYWENLASGIQAGIRMGGTFKPNLFNWSHRIGVEISRLETENQSVPIRLRILKWLAMRLVFRPLLDRIGSSNIRIAYVGGAPVNPEVLCFFQAIGLNLKQCYGMTETCGFFPIDFNKTLKAETACNPFPDTEIRIADDQEILVMSKSNFEGYYKNIGENIGPVRNGWLHTGDIAQFDEKGELLIIGRKQNSMNIGGGRSFSPEFIEARLKFSPYIKEAIVLRNGLPYSAALINIDFENVGSWAEKRRILCASYEQLSLQNEVEQLIREETAQINSDLPDTMKILKIVLLDKMLDENGHVLTGTGNVKKDVVLEEYKEMVDAIYADQNDISVQARIKYKNGNRCHFETSAKILDV